MPESISSWLWKPLAVILVFVVASGLTRVIMGSDEHGLSSQQQAVLDGLRDETDELVVQYADIKALLGDWYDCTKPEGEDTVVIYSWDADHNITGVRNDVAATNVARADSDLCDEGNGSWLAAAVTLTDDRQRIFNMRATYRDLASGTQEQLQKLIEFWADRWGFGDEPNGGSWLSAQVGDSGYSLKFRAFDPDSNIEYTSYKFAFNRDVVIASLVISLPTSIADDDDAVAVARAFDERIQAAIDSMETADE